MKGQRARETGVVRKALQHRGKNEFFQELSHKVEFDTLVVHVQVTGYAFTGKLIFEWVWWWEGTQINKVGF